jgi:isopentenyl-diphosphate Delta-isomerase
VHVKRGRDYLLEAVESPDADGIFIYINPLHEILQKEGESDFKGCLDILGDIVEDFPYPIFIKEVGFGLGRSVMEWASIHRIAGLDVAGIGGTNWARVEGYLQRQDYSVFEELGVSTKDALVMGNTILREDQYLIASGGLRNGVEMAKCFALGAHLASMALPFLKWAADSADEVVRQIARLREELTVTLWYCGCRTPADAKGKALSVAP